MTTETQTKNICECGHPHYIGIYFQEVCPELDCPCKKFTPRKQDAHSQEKIKNEVKSAGGTDVTPDARKGNSSPQTKKRIKIKLSEESINEILNLQEELGLEKSETRENRRMFYSQEWEYLFG